MNKSRPLNFIKKHKVWSVVLAVVFITLILAYGMPLFVGDGTGKFSRVKKRVATDTLMERYEGEDRMSRAVNILTAFQYYIEDVSEMPQQEAKRYCRLVPGDDGTGYYYARVSQVTWFGFRMDLGQTNAYEACSEGRALKNLKPSVAN